MESKRVVLELFQNLVFCKWLDRARARKKKEFPKKAEIIIDNGGMRLI